MSIEQSDVEKIAHLARLQVSAEQSARLTKDLSNILGLVDQLQSADTKDVEPMANPLDAVQVLRADAVTEENLRDKFQSIAPEKEDGLYLVPKVID